MSRAEGLRKWRETSVPSPTTRRVGSEGYVQLGDYAEHRHVAEQALGRKLTQKEVVHHWDEDKTNNVGSNLLICTRAYHNLIHQRMRSLEACGDPGAKKCRFCGEYTAGLRRPYHNPCAAAYQKARRVALSTS